MQSGACADGNGEGRRKHGRCNESMLENRIPPVLRAEELLSRTRCTKSPVLRNVAEWARADGPYCADPLRETQFAVPAPPLAALNSPRGCMSCTVPAALLQIFHRPPEGKRSKASGTEDSTELQASCIKDITALLASTAGVAAGRLARGVHFVSSTHLDLFRSPPNPPSASIRSGNDPCCSLRRHASLTPCLFRHPGISPTIKSIRTGEQICW